MTVKRKRSSNNTVSDLDAFKRNAIDQIYAGKPLTGKNGIFSDLIKEVLETALDEELNQHIVDEKSELGNEFNNRREKVSGFFYQL